MSNIYNDLHPISDKRREMYHRIINGEKNFQFYSHRFFYLDAHFPEAKLDAALTWLCKNNCVGKLFLAWYTSFCGNSDLEMHRKLLMVVDNQGLVPLIGGKNFRL